MMVLILLLLSAALAQSQNNGFVKPKNRVINGFKVDAMDAKMLNLVHSTVKLRIKKGSSTSGCGGSLISSNIVLTAAHCMRSYKYNEETKREEERTVEHVDIYFGITSKSEYYLPETVHQRVEANNVYIHDDWDLRKNNHNDIALVILPKPVYKSNKISCISLPDKNICDKKFTELTICGWGRTEGNIKPDDIRAAHVQHLPNKNCTDNYGGAFNENIHLCLLGLQREKSCSGDSGGPVAYTDSDQNNKQYVVGLDSWGASPCENNYPSVYINVCSYSDWINNVIETTKASTKCSDAPN